MCGAPQINIYIYILEYILLKKKTENEHVCSRESPHWELLRLEEPTFFRTFSLEIMSIFDKLKSSLGVTPASKGHVLGGSSSESSTGSRFEITFQEQSIGIKIAEHPKTGLPVVSEVSKGSAAQSQGVKSGDVVATLEGQAISSTQEFVELVTALGRPVVIG